jgi:UDP-glucose 4-epimerase
LSIFITGGQGYIGSHVTKLLVSEGFEPIVLDNRSGSNQFPKVLGAKYFDVSINDASALNKLVEIFASETEGTVIHLSGIKSVSNSFQNPTKYLENNLGSTSNLLKAMEISGLHNIIFSSSAAVYGGANTQVAEDSPTTPISEYGNIKLKEEKLIEEYVSKFSGASAILRLFNVVGCGANEFRETHGENIFPMITKAILQKKDFYIYGKNYESVDGTCVRDYIDVEDVASAILKATLEIRKSNVGVVNIGSSEGTSVLQLVKKVNLFQNLNYKVDNPRMGDIPALVASISKAKDLLDWRPHRTLQESIKNSFFKI